jgi:hypothetical protein
MDAPFMQWNLALFPMPNMTTGYTNADVSVPQGQCREILTEHAETKRRGREKYFEALLAGSVPHSQSSMGVSNRQHELTANALMLRVDRWRSRSPIGMAT